MEMIRSKTWVLVEIVKASTAFMIAPFASGFFWLKLGFGGGSSDRLLSSARRSLYIRPSAHTASPIMSTRHGIEGDDLGMSEEIADAVDSRIGSPKDLEAQNELSTEAVEAEVSGTSRNQQLLAPESMESFGEADLHQEAPQGELGGISTDNGPTLTRPTDDVPLASLPLSSRPPSMVFSLFTHRATACLSSFELFSDGMVEEHFSTSLSSTLPREPTKAEIELVEKILRPDMRIMEEVIEAAIESRGVNEELVVPSGHSYFDTMDMSFADVSIDPAGINTAEFLRAVSSLLQMFEQFASSAFLLVQSAILEDLRRIQVRVDAFPEATTLQLLIVGESKERRRLASTSLLWTVRGLKFLAMALRRNLESETEEELSDSFTSAWNAEYSSYFTWIIRPLFKLLIKACPPRVSFYERLGSPPERVTNDLNVWLTAMESQVDVMERFFSAAGL